MTTEPEYLELNRNTIRIQSGVVEGIARDVSESFTGSASEVGGLLLGLVRRTSEVGAPSVSIERYRQVPCDHSFGPGFVLDSNGRREMEQAAGAEFEGGSLAVVGFYRSHTRPGFQLEDSDRDLISRYFGDTTDVVLLIHPETSGDIPAQFYSRAADGAMQPGEAFPFRPAKTAPKRKLVPDYIPAAVAASRIIPTRENPTPNDDIPESEPTARRKPFEEPPPATLAGSPNQGLWKGWLPLAIAAAIVGGLLWAALNARSHEPQKVAAPIVVTQEPARPLGLYVDAAGPVWRVSWNTNATALHDAKGVQLFVREGDDQNRIDLTRQDITTGTRDYTPTGKDVTFRLEVTEPSGGVAAESFRVTQAAAAAAAASRGIAPRQTSSPVPAPGASALIVVHKVAPEVSARMRSKISDNVAIDVRVFVDSKGKVTSATPIGGKRSGVEKYLVGRAVAAAKNWRFENGPGDQTIRFNFTQ
jgi:hypothetical protein